MSLEEIIARFEQRGFRCRLQPDGGYRCQCSGHGGHDLNLSLHRGDNGGVLVTCHSHHCSESQIVAGIGLTVADLMPRAHPANGSELSHVERVYPYRDEAGNCLFEVIRLPDKRFWQRLPGAAHGGIGGVRRVLFGLPELLATSAGELICIVEGEKDAVNVAQLGIAATTNPHGAGRWKQEYTDWLKAELGDRRFLILPDNDPQGIAHAEEVFQSLARAGLDARIRLLPNLAPKGDVSEWIGAGGSAAALREMAAPVPHPLDLKVMDGRQLEAADLPLPEAIIPHLLYRGFSTLLAGDSKLGKSSLLLRGLLASSAGGWWLDRDRRTENRLPKMRILFINFEDPLFLTRERARAMMGPDPLPPDFLTMEPPYGYSLAQLLDWLHARYQQLSLDAVVLDPIAVAAEWADETDNAEVARTFKSIQQLASETQLGVLCAHHVTKKPGERGLNIRGASAIKANVLGYLVLEPEQSLFRLSGVNKLVGEWDVTLDRSIRDWSWWIVQSRAGSTRTPQQAAKEGHKVDLLHLIRDQPGITTEKLMTFLDLKESTCRDYLDELAAAELLFSHDLPRDEGRRGRAAQGWFPTPAPGH